jgi:hypothetical protein
MNIVDSCGWLEYFADGPNAYFFSRPLEETADLVVSTITSPIPPAKPEAWKTVGRSKWLEPWHASHYPRVYKVGITSPRQVLSRGPVL